MIRLIANRNYKQKLQKKTHPYNYSLGHNSYRVEQLKFVDVLAKIKHEEITILYILIHKCASRFVAITDI